MQRYNQSDELMEYALSVGETMANEYLTKGDYFPKTSWGCEGNIYPSQMGIAFLSLYEHEKKQLFLDATRAIIETNERKQLASGGWPLMLGYAGAGTRFCVSPHIAASTSSVEDLPPTATALRLMAEYRQLTADARYDMPLEKGFRYLKEHWNQNKGQFDEMLSGEALKLRANPKDYHVYAYQAALALTSVFPEADKYAKPLYKSVKETFERMNEHTYPLLHAIHAATIITTEGASNYVTSVVEQRIRNELALKSRFIIHSVPGALGHHDGLRGICLNEGHIRNSVGAAMAMKFYDTHVREGTFCTSVFYNDLKQWILSMYHKGFFYEFLDVRTGQRLGVGTPGQFLPVQWITGCL